MPFALARTAVKAARRFGYSLTPTWDAHHLSLAMHLEAIFPALGIDCVLDVGANSGQYRRFLRERVGYEGLIVSFEPLPDLARTLMQEAATDPNWVVLECALGSTNGTQTFQEMSDTQFSSFLAPDERVVNSFVRQNRPTKSIEVAVKTLDSLFPALQEKHGFSRAFLKMDTQGYDLEVIKGSKATLPDVPALQTEASVLPIYRDMPDFRTVLDRLGAEGYELSTVAPTNPVGTLRLIEFDCVMVRKSAARSAS